MPYIVIIIMEHYISCYGYEPTFCCVTHSVGIAGVRSARAEKPAYGGPLC